MKNCLGIINLDESGSRMDELVRKRTLAAIPLASRYRVIDFVLSNMANSGIEDIGIFTENKSRSLVEHLTNGRPWDLDRKKDGLRVFNFGDNHPHNDDVHNFIHNIRYIERSKKDYVLISPSYMICNIDYSQVMKHHIKSGNDITIVYKNVDNAKRRFLGCETVNVNEDNRIISIGENISRDKDASINMEMYLMKTELFLDIIHDCIKTGKYRKIKRYISNNLDKHAVGAYEFKGYLSCINSVKSYFDTNLELLNQDKYKELFHNGNTIYTKSKDEPPTQYTKSSLVNNSTIGNGSYIEGEVKNCIIGRRVIIQKGAKLKNCIILDNSIVGTNVMMSNVIADKDSLIPGGRVIRGTEENPVSIQMNGDYYR
ncbi:glucose-1-phosphate adenylyltransferase subunit GlgD [Clostridium lamae]|uniref:glucose-1-phosphate adenylyltransferase subunit GlgD n=1 Tax=Clostridium TaxID=1485 RepID=UPI00374E4B3E